MLTRGRQAAVRAVLPDGGEVSVCVRWRRDSRVSDLAASLTAELLPPARPASAPASPAEDPLLDDWGLGSGDVVQLDGMRKEPRRVLPALAVPPRPAPAAGEAPPPVGDLPQPGALPLWPMGLALLPAVGMLLLVRDPRLLVLVLAAPLATVGVQLAQRASSRRSDTKRRAARVQAEEEALRVAAAVELAAAVWVRAVWPGPAWRGRAGRRQVQAWCELHPGMAPPLAALRVGVPTGAALTEPAPVVVPVYEETVLVLTITDERRRALLLAVARWLLVQLVDQRPAPILVRSSSSGDRRSTAPSDWAWALPALARHADRAVSSGPVWHVEDGHSRLVISARRTSDVPRPAEVQDIQVVVADVGDAQLHTGGHVDGTTLGTTGTTSIGPEILPDPEAWRRLAALVREEVGESSQPPERLSLEDLGRILTAAEVVAAWRTHHRDLRLQWLVGGGSQGPVIVDLTKTPHVLVAGTTGAGKSGALQAMLLDLAQRYPPDRLAAVVVDCKGGTSLQAVAHLPHIADLVTDLDGAVLERALASLSAELRRRARLLRDAGQEDLSAWRHQGSEVVPPDLLVVVDEFAVLADQRPDLLDRLVDVGRRGRSLGVHLVLASQSVSGVVSGRLLDNVDVVLAMRLTDPAQSRQLVGHDGASRISPHQPGRAVLAIGGAASPVQLPWVGANADSRGRLVDVSAAGRVEDLDAVEAAPDGPPQRDLVLREVALAFSATGGGRAAPPWCPLLPELWHSSVPAVGDCVALGLLDLPEQQAQIVLTAELDAPVGLALVGPARSGRSHALRSLVLQAAAARSPAELRIVVVDGRGRPHADLGMLPHVAAVVDPSDEDHLAALLDLLDEPFAGAGQGRMHTLLVIDDLGLLQAQLDRPAGAALQRRLASVLTTGRQDGIGVAVSAAGEQELGRSVRAGLDRVVHLRTARVPGRAHADGLEVQLAVAAPELPSAVIERWQGVSGPPALEPLPRLVLLDELAQPPRLAAVGSTVTRDLHPAPPLRVGRTATGILELDLTRDGPLLVVGPPRSGRTSTLACVAAAAARTGRRIAVVSDPADLLALAETAEPAEVPLLAVVDDADRFLEALSPGYAAMGHLLARPNVDVVVAVSEHRAARALSGWLASLRSAHHALLLAPSPLAREAFPEADLRQLPASLPGRALVLRPGRRPVAAQLARSAEPGQPDQPPATTRAFRSAVRRSWPCGQPQQPDSRSA
ncbi:MAG: FtsK/SpoIIIE domain-containing protein [Actinomycetales bacterium]